MKKIKISILCAMLAGTCCCVSKYSNTVMRDLEYKKDPKTGLCFAIYSTGNNTGLAEVSCFSVRKHLSKK